jgi:hypothetical protein
MLTTLYYIVLVVHLLKGERISDCVWVCMSQDIHPLLLCRLREKEREAVDKETQRANEQIGQDVSKKAQLLFNGLAKT